MRHDNGNGAFGRSAAATPLSAYEALVQAGALKPDEAQRAAVLHLERLQAALAQPDGGGGLLSRVLPRRKRKAVRGLYLWGPVGRGKTMLMDLFYRAVEGVPKRRAHFHAFMEDVHARIHALRQAMRAGRIKAGDPIPPVAASLAEEARLLCFDEFQVTDIADAMILGRLFDRLFEAGTMVVATSNVAPRDLYADGLNRDLFLPFIARLEERLAVVRLAPGMDYRRERFMNARLYLTPLGPEADAGMDRLWTDLTRGEVQEQRVLSVKGRTLTIPCAAGRAARFDFPDLCERPLGPADYLKIAETFDTVLVDRVPVLQPRQRNEARRLILFVDTLYDRGVRLALSAAAEPDALYPQGEFTAEFARTASRLMEMRSADYLAAGPRAGVSPLNSARAASSGDADDDRGADDDRPDPR